MEFKERSYYLDKAEREIAGLKAEILNTKMELQKQQESLEIERGRLFPKPNMKQIIMSEK